MSQNPATVSPSSLVDGHGRQVDYLRLSITDRCDFRCTYCMAEHMTFLPRKQVLSLEELTRVGRVFVELGVRKIRVTGGEPLIRKGVEHLLGELGSLHGLQELAITTNGSQLAAQADGLRKAGVNSLNISLDSLDPVRFAAMTRVGKLDTVLEGIERAVTVGFDRIRLNAVILHGHNDDEILPLADFALQRGVDLAFIEEMPLGQVNKAGKPLQLLSSAEAQAVIESRYSLTPLASAPLGGPARYWEVNGSSSRIGFISPHSNNFCASCNRLRVTAEGQLLLCLGNDNAISLRDLLRAGVNDVELADEIRRALAQKPERHVFDQPDEPQIVRFMNASGG